MFVALRVFVCRATRGCDDRFWCVVRFWCVCPCLGWLTLGDLRERIQCCIARVPPLLIATLRTSFWMDAAHLSASHSTHERTVRQFEDISALPTPATQQPAPGLLQFPACSPPHPPGTMVDIITTLLANRADAASILSTVALRIASAPPTPAPLHHHEQPGVHSPPSAQPATAQSSVAFVKERTRSQRDAALLEHAVSLSLAACAASSGHAVSPVVQEFPPDKCSSSPPRPISSPPPLVTITTIPSNLLSSPSIGTIKIVLTALAKALVLNSA